MPELPEIVYTPESALCHPGRLLREMFRDLRASRELAWRLFVRDTAAQYRQSMLAYIWALLPPFIASLPFVYLNSQGLKHMTEAAKLYFVHLVGEHCVGCKGRPRGLLNATQEADRLEQRNPLA
jgi:lipopolysaccharide transport system permease protein